LKRPSLNHPAWYPQRERYFHLNGHLRCNIVSLAHSLGETSSSAIHPGNLLVIDESIYEYNGDCPVRRYIPRKPHPNGLEVFGLAGLVRVGTDLLPFVYDFEPFTHGNTPTPQEAMILLHSRLRARHPAIRPSLLVDSAFGSFTRIQEIMNAGGAATMSMSSNVKPWLWEMLDWDCAIDEGRVASIPGLGIVVSSFKVQTERGNLHQIKTISSAFQVVVPDDAETIVLKVSDRRKSRDQLEYFTHWSDGSTDWLPTSQFIDEDGTANTSWLDFANESDLISAFSAYSLNQLKAMCSAQKLKSTGEKGRLVKRMVKALMATFRGKEGIEALIESKIGPKLGSDGAAAQIRRFYAENYQALDRFDRVWYEIRYHTRPRDWESHSCWSLLHAAVINARTVWCAAQGRRVPILDFLANLVSSFARTIMP